MFEQSLSFKKVDNLNEQKNTIASLTKLQRDDVELALIQFNGKSTHLHQQIGKLHNLQKYNFTDKYVFLHSQEYFEDLNKLSALTNAFNEAAHKYYVKTELKEPELEKETKENLQRAFISINSHIDSMLFKNTAYDQNKFETAEIIIAIYFLLVPYFTTYLCGSSITFDDSLSNFLIINTPPSSW